MKCSNCGATISKKDEKCGFCGAMNYSGARKKYMNRLYDLKDQMEDVYEESQKRFLVTFGKSLLLGIALVIGISAVTGAFVRLSRVQERNGDAQSARRIMRGLQWANDHFAELDSLYEQKNLKGIQTIISKQDYSTGVYTALRYWQHYDWYECCEGFEKVGDFVECVEQGKGIDTYQYYLPTVFRFLYEEKKNMDLLDEEELEHYNSICESALNALGQLGYSKEEGRQLYQDSLQNGYPDRQYLYEHMGGK